MYSLDVGTHSPTKVYIYQSPREKKDNSNPSFFAGLCICGWIPAALKLFL